MAYWKPILSGLSLTCSIASAPATAIPAFSITLDGVELRVRQLGKGDLWAIGQHLLALGSADRRSRFLGNMSDEAIAAYARRLDPVRAILIGAFDSSEHLVGLAQAHPTETVGKVEVAVSIDEPFRCHGLGRRLVASALALAFGCGAQSAEIYYAPGNRPLVALVRALGGRFGPRLGYALIDRGISWNARKAA